jgi:hypothetical protein
LSGATLAGLGGGDIPAVQAASVAKVSHALPVFNEAAHVSGVLDEVLRFTTDVLVVDDGSTDGTADILARRNDVRVVRHAANRGYGAALATAFAATPATAAGTASSRSTATASTSRG